jgi:hypothetical protein
MMPPLSTQDTLKVIRAKYENALICVGCGRLLATRRESYAKSNLIEAQRLEYVCAECRLVPDLEQARQDRLAQLATARAIATDQRSKRARLAATRFSTESQSRASSALKNSNTSNPINLTAEPQGAFRGGRRSRPGRPRVAAPLKERVRAYSRAYRERQRLTRSEVPAHAL